MATYVHSQPDALGAAAQSFARVVTNRGNLGSVREIIYRASACGWCGGVKSARGEVSVLSTGPFPQAASRTRRARFRAPGAPEAVWFPFISLTRWPATASG